MKKIFPLIVASVAMFLSSCANVDEGDRYIKVESSDAKRAVLVEEFTGQKCINCPEAHEELTKNTKRIWRRQCYKCLYTCFCVGCCSIKNKCWRRIF